MKKTGIIILALGLCFQTFGQEDLKFDKETILNEFSNNACRCIDSIETFDRANEKITKDINHCIDKQVVGYQATVKLAEIFDSTKVEKSGDSKIQKTISVNVNKESEDYKNYYYEMERYLMSNCGALKSKIASSEEQSKNSVSENPEALKFYNKGISEAENGNYKDAIDLYKKALIIDPNFAFAWDNIGLSYRKLNDFDKAIESYNKSLEIDPKGVFPLQNIAVAYQYKKEYQKAIEAYEKLSKLDKNNPEIFYGIGNIYALSLKDFEKGLDNMCKAYNLYTAQKSPYRSDAEKIIQMIYKEMKKQGNEDKFNEILKKNNITPN